MQHFKNIIDVKNENDPKKLGYAIGRYWAKYFEMFNNYKDFLPKINRDYLKNDYIIYIKKSNNAPTDEDPSQEYQKMLQEQFPDFVFIFQEIEGMIEGFNDNTDNYYLSREAAFEFCLGELNTVRSSKCSTVLLKSNDGYVLGHNEEWACGEIDPLLIVKHENFVSISYPFQLLGSAGGYNKYFAFQGNSIGTSHQPCKTLNVLRDRIPKTFYSRWLLTLNDEKYLSNINKFLQEFKLSLPSHNYIVSKEACHSISIIPKRRNNDKSEKVFSIKKITGDKHFHTNHFLKGSDLDASGWNGDDSWMESSNKRYGLLKQSLESLGDSNKSDYLSFEAKKMLVSLIKTRHPTKQLHEADTSGTLIFTVKKHISLSSFFYFPEMLRPGFPG